MRKLHAMLNTAMHAIVILALLNGIKRGSLMRSDDAVETGECHTDDKRRTAQEEAEDQRDRNATVPKRAWRHVDVVFPYPSTRRKLCVKNINKF